MLNDIANYIRYLSAYHKLSISIHNKNLNSNRTICNLTPYNIHRNPYCLFVKSDIDRHMQCIQFQQEIRKLCGNDFFSATCMCGVCEYITPIKYNSEFLGYISIGGYKGNRDYCTCYAHKNNISANTLEQKYDTYLKTEKPDEKMVQTLAKPLAAMLATAFMQDVKVDDEFDDSLYKHILSVIHAGAFSKLSIEDISNACHCSQSTLSHLFKKRSGTTINKYITDLRIKKAKTLLTSTNLHITDIAYLCGFSDSNYFTYVFSKQCGIPPLQYRKQKSNSSVNI